MIKNILRYRRKLTRWENNSADGMDNYKNKTPQPSRQGRNEESCDTSSHQVVSIELVVRVQIVAVDIPTVVAIVPNVEHVAVAVRRIVRPVFLATTP